MRWTYKSQCLHQRKKVSKKEVYKYILVQDPPFPSLVVHLSLFNTFTENSHSNYKLLTHQNVAVFLFPSQALGGSCAGFVVCHAQANTRPADHLRGLTGLAVHGYVHLT